MHPLVMTDSSVRTLPATAPLPAVAMEPATPALAAVASELAPSVDVSACLRIRSSLVTG